MDHQTNRYLGYYKAQSGGELPAFHAARRGQYGSGLGDILRGIFRTLFPIAAKGASTFLSETLKAKDAGASGWGAAAKAAIAPTAQNVITGAMDQVREATATKQEGGRRRSKKSPHRQSETRGDAGLGGKSNRQQGGRHRKRKGSYKRGHASSTKKLNF